MLLQLVKHTDVVLEWDLLVEEISFKNDLEVFKILNLLHKVQDKSQTTVIWNYIGEIIEDFEFSFNKTFYIVDEVDVARLSSFFEDGEYILFLKVDEDDEFHFLGNLYFINYEVDQLYIELLTDEIEDFLNQ